MSTQPGTTQAHTNTRAANAETRMDSGATDAGAAALPPRLLDLHAAGRYLGLSYWTIRDLVFGGALPTVKLPCPRAGDGRR